MAPVRQLDIESTAGQLLGLARQLFERAGNRAGGQPQRPPADEDPERQHAQHFDVADQLGPVQARFTLRQQFAFCTHEARQLVEQLIDHDGTAPERAVLHRERPTQGSQSAASLDRQHRHDDDLAIVVHQLTDPLGTDPLLRIVADQYHQGRQGIVEPAGGFTIASELIRRLVDQCIPDQSLLIKHQAVDLLAGEQYLEAMRGPAARVFGALLRYEEQAAGHSEQQQQAAEGHGDFGHDPPVCQPRPPELPLRHQRRTPFAAWTNARSVTRDAQLFAYEILVRDMQHVRKTPHQHFLVRIEPTVREGDLPDHVDHALTVFVTQ